MYPPLLWLSTGKDPLTIAGLHPLPCCLWYGGAGGSMNSPQEIERHFITQDYLLHRGMLKGWDCHWTFAVRREGAGHVYRATCETAPRQTMHTERALTPDEAREQVRRIADIERCPLFKKAGGHGPA